MLALCHVLQCTLPVATPVGRRLGSGWKKQIPVNSTLRDVKLADGCRHVFLDVGSNVGLHLRFLMEGESVFPKSQYLKWGHFQKYFGPSFAKDPTVCAFAFEPNWKHEAKLRHMVMRLRAGGRRIEVLHAAASNKPGSITFYHRNGDNSGATGFGASPEVTMCKSSMGKKCSKMENNTYTKESLPTIDLAQFVAEEVVGRRIPPVPNGIAPSDARPPAIVMKLDSEGAELLILERMLDLCVLCELNFISLEYHPKRLYKEDGVVDSNTYSAHPDVFDLLAAGLAASREATRNGDPLAKVMAERSAERATHRRPTSARMARCGRRQSTAANTCVRFSARDDETYAWAPDISGGLWEVEDPRARCPPGLPDCGLG